MDTKYSFSYTTSAYKHMILKWFLATIFFSVTRCIISNRMSVSRCICTFCAPMQSFILRFRDEGINKQLYETLET